MADQVTVGFQLSPLSLRVTRAQLVRYAGASGDFNPIHWNERTAIAVGLPGVIAHGMLTMALATRIVTSWAVDPARVREVSVRFTRPVVVPDDEVGALLKVSAVVGALSDSADGVSLARIDITTRFEGQTVLGKARAFVVL